MLWLSHSHYRGSNTVKTLFGPLNNARYIWYIVFGRKRCHERSPSNGILPAVCTETDLKTKPTESFTRQIKKYSLPTAAIWLSLERQQHSTEPSHSYSKTRFYRPYCVCQALHGPSGLECLVVARIRAKTAV